MTELIIDGSQGEGGGQILRTSLALSLVTGRPFRIERIRAARKKPGLLRQHLTAVASAAKIGNAAVTGDSLGSSDLTFTPGTKPAAGDHTFAIGTAGSATLVLQTVLPALLIAEGESRLTLQGGTHNPLAPPYDFLEKTFLPLLARMGGRVTSRLVRPGFYPAGGGEILVTIQGGTVFQRLDLPSRGDIRRKKARVLLANLPRDIAERELAVVKSRLGLEDDDLEIVMFPGSRGPGNVVLIELVSDEITEVVAAFGERGVRAETVADAAVAEARRYLAAGVPVGEHLADQLLVPMAMGAGGSFLTRPPTRHTTTNVDVVRRFLDVPITIERVDGGARIESERGAIIRIR